MAGNHDVYIFEVEGEFRVRPAVIMSNASAGLKFRNLTDCPAMLIFPPALILGQNIVTMNEKDNKPGDKVTVNLSKGIPSDGNYPYTVFVIKDGNAVPAKGESAPSIIVDR